MINHPLYVLTCISNPARFESRYRLYHQFADHIQGSGAILYTAELAHGERPFMVTEADNPHHLQLRGQHELWHKENLLCLLAQRLPADWRYLAWIDADIHFCRPDWVQETLQALQHYAVIQPWGQCSDLGPSGEHLKLHNSFLSVLHTHALGLLDYGQAGHPGYAWACTRSAWDTLGGLIDFAALGSADRHMAYALVGRVHDSASKGLSEAYLRRLSAWQARAQLLRRNVGHVPGLILHHWHGKKKDRGYGDRWQILVRHGFDPDLDLVRDAQGIYQLSDRSPELRDGIRAYFRSRNEDSVDV